jgi:SAM-dependent methyltransferase
MKNANSLIDFLKISVKRIPYIGCKVYCPVCQKYSGKFAPAGLKRKNHKCIWCGSFERHRFIWLFLERKMRILSEPPRSMLHFAPEKGLERRLKNVIGKGYISADIDESRAMFKTDITNIQFPDNHFGSIFCSHVLEHITDDRQAMGELYRILAPSGWAIIAVPITATTTIENPDITDPKLRLQLYGQEDHVRRYGKDFVNRLSEVGFQVKSISSANISTPNETEKMKLGEPIEAGIFLCKKARLEE